MIESSRGLADGLIGDAAAAAGKTTPSLAVAGLSLAGVSLQDWVLILTAIYTLLQLMLLTPKILRFLRGRWEAGDGE